MAPVRWGICGTGAISGSFAAVINELLSSEDHQVVAVVSRELEKSRNFADKYSGTPYDSYEQFAKDANIDIVYVGTIHPHHFELCKLFIRAGKNVLCEKPLTMNSRQSSELVREAKDKNVFFMEALWSRFFPAYHKIREEISAGVIGDVMKVNAEFNVKMDQVPRVREKRLGGGVLLDIGIYVVQFATMIFNEDPQDVQAMAELNEEGVDLATSIQLRFSGGRFAQLYCDARFSTKRRAVIYGTKGSIEIPDMFLAPTEVITPSGVHKFPLRGSELNYVNDQGLIYEIQCVGKCLQQGKKECPEMPHSETLRLARIMDTVRRQIGVVYDADL